MHDTAMAAGAAFFSTYFDGAAPRVLEVGALDVNGSLRAVAPPGSEYVGIDLEAGPGVDLVLAADQDLPFPMESFDACVSVSCFEHDLMFWETFRQMAEVTRLGGFIFLNVPSNGPYHRYPSDNWRFYPDAGIALAAWARQQGQALHLVESGILRRRKDVWNDFVAVFQKGEAPSIRCSFLLDGFPDATNVHLFNSTQVLNVEEVTEDVSLFLASQSKARSLADDVQQLTEALAAEKSTVRKQHRELAEQGEILEETRRALAEQCELLEEMRRALAEQGELLDEMRRALAEKQGHIDAICASTSWRMTAPLRAARRILNP